jgi:hypothetical protein
MKADRAVSPRPRIYSEHLRLSLIQLPYQTPFHKIILPAHAEFGA